MAHVTRIATTLDGKDYGPGDLILGSESFPNFQALVDCKYLVPVSQAEKERLLSLQVPVETVVPVTPVVPATETKK